MTLLLLFRGTTTTVSPSKTIMYAATRANIKPTSRANIAPAVRANVKVRP